jgi:hypothetical protein
MKKTRSESLRSGSNTRWFHNNAAYGGVMDPLLQIHPHIRFVSAMGTHRLAPNLSRFLSSRGLRIGRFLFDFNRFQAAGDHHFGFIMAIFALADFFEFLFSHWFRLLFFRLTVRK